MGFSSGFFVSPADVRSAHASDFELVHGSESSAFLIYRGNVAGKYRCFKILKPEFRGNLVYEDLLKKEYEIGCRMEHPNIRQYFGYRDLPDFGRALEMEWVDGVPLSELSVPDKRTALKIICEVCDALTYIHGKQVIFRDLKPENILVTHNGSNAKLIDFGYSDADWLSLLKTPAGTREYASPELLAGDPVDSRTDIWSLGALIREIIPSKRKVAKCCMRHNPERRYRTASDVKSALLRSPVWPWAATVLAVAASFALIWIFRPEDQFAEPVALENFSAPADTVVMSIEDVLREATLAIMEAGDN